MTSKCDVCDVCVVYSEFPNEILSAFCLKEICGYTVEKLKNIKDVKERKIIIMFSDYSQSDTMKDVVFKIYAGTPAFSRSQEGIKVLGPWVDFMKENSQAFFAYSYWKTFSNEEKISWVSKTLKSQKEFDSLAERGKTYYEKEVSVAKYTAEKSISTENKNFRVATIGMSAGIHVLHLEMAKIQPTTNSTLVHYILNENGALINRWSFKALINDMFDRGDYVFFDLLKCSEFGPPKKDVKIGELRGGRDGLDFTQGLKVLMDESS